MMETIIMPPQTLEQANVKAPPKLRIAVHIDAEVLNPEVARRKANVWLLMYAGHLLRADCPELIIKAGLFWRYEVVLTSPQGGDVGSVGQILVKADTGEVIATESLADEFAANGSRLIKSRKVAQTAELVASTDVNYAEAATAR